MHIPHFAVIGLSGRYAGPASSTDRLWSVLRDGIDVLGNPPEGRFDSGYLNADSDAPNRTYCMQGGYLPAIDLFDADFFGMSPREARQVDPQQRLLLELAWEALENAAIVPKRIAGSRTGVYIGISSHDYSDLVGPGSPDAYSNTGSALSIASNRVSYVLDLHGPSMSIDTACSSGMVALHQALRSLGQGDCDLAMVGGVNILAHARPWIGFAKASMLSPEGRCKSFDATGAGFARAEGGGMLVIKRLEEAERDGDNILGVLIGSGVNSDGRTMGLSLPSMQAQEALLRQVYDECHVTADDVFYVEAHGTGTAVGDPIECEAIGRVLGSPRGDTPLHIGSIKSNIGHLEPAAGIAGVTKMLLALKHGEIPAQLHYNTPNPAIDFEAWRLRVVDKTLTLPRGGPPLTFGINSFGFGGTNAHAVLREYRPGATRTVAAVPALPTASPTQHLLLLSAQTEAALADMAKDYAAWLRADTAASWPDICATAARCRAQLPQRLALVAMSAAEAADKLDAFRAGETVPGLATARTGQEPARVAFVYSGNGPQWFAMGRDLMAESPQFRQAMVEVDDIFRAREGWSLIEELQRPQAEARMALTEVAQPTLFALQVALTTVLRQAGVTEHAVFGHSVGEAAAAWASGALTLEQATEVIIHRSAMQARTAGRGKMAAIGVGPDEARAAMEQAGGWLELAATNGPRAVTVAGDPDALERLRAALTEAGKFARVLPLDYAFHSRAMDPIETELRSRLAHLTPSAERIPFVSTVDGTPIPGASLGADYWWRNIRAPVQFQAAVEHAVRDLGITVFVEIGPHPVLRDYVLQCAKALDRPVAAIATLRRPAAGRPESDEANLWLALCTCHSLGATDGTATYERPARPVALPTYPWQRTRHWRGQVPLPDMYPALDRVHPLLGWQPPGTEGLWRGALDLGMLPYLADHVVQDSALFPAAGHIELGLAAAAQILGDGPVEIENFEIVRPLVVTALPITSLLVAVDAADGMFEVRSRPDAFAGTWTTHAKGRITKIEGAPAAPIDLDALRSALPIAVTGPTHYEIAARRGLLYGPQFQGVRVIRVSAPDSQTKQAVAEIEVTASVDGYRSHPTVLDSALQVLITLLGRTEPRLCAYIPIQVESVRSLAPLPGRVVCHVEITRESERSGSADIAVCDASGAVLLQLRGARFRKVDFKQGAITPLLTEIWRPDPATAPLGLPVALPALHALLPALAVKAAALSETDARRGFYQVVAPAMDRLLGAYAAEALLQLGAAETGATLVQLQRKNRIMPVQTGLLHRLLDWAEADGYLRRDGARLLWREDAPAADLQTRWRDLFLAHPSYSAELILAARYGERLASILREGTPEPSDRGDAPMEQLQDGAPTRALVARFATITLAGLLEQWPADRPVRILELAGGSGGLTAALLPLLPGERTDYVFTDTSAAALDRAEQRFAPFPFLRALSFDAALPAAEQDSAPKTGAFDVVIAGPTLAGAAASAQVLENAHALLAPGGWLIALDPGASRLEMLLQSLASPGSRVADPDAFLEAGFEQVLCLDDSAASPQGGRTQQTVTVAQKAALSAPAFPARPPMAASRTMLLLVTPAETAFATLLADALTHRGMIVDTVAVDSDGTGAWFDRPADDIVHLAGLAGPGANGAAALLALQDQRVLATLNLVQAIKSAATPIRPTLRFVTHGAFAGAAQTGPLDPGQAPLWGFGRVLANEYPDIAPRLIDLHAPLDAASAALLADELLRTDEEMEVQLLAGQRFVARMQPTTETQLAAETNLRHSHATPAFRLDFAGHGGIDSLVTRAVPRVEPGPGQVELRVLAAGLNFRDVLWTMGMLPEEAVEQGFSGPTIGMECAGEVLAIGDGVTGLAPGDRVVAFASSTFASHVTTDAGAVARIPDGISAAQAATIPTTFLTAWYALDYLARLRPGERVLIHGAAGGVGLAAVQIAKLRGAEVFGTAGSDEKRRVLRLLGVDHVLNSRSLAFADDVMRITGGKGVDVVLNSLAGEAITKNLGLLKPFGRFLEIGKRDLYANSRIGLRPFRNNLSYFGIDADTLLVERADLARELFAEVIALFAEGKLRPLPHTAFPIARAGEAFRLMQQSRHIGKIVLTMDEAAAPVTAIDTSLTLRQDGTYLVTGGLGGFGLATAKWLVAQGAGAVALLSRRGPQTDEAHAGVAAIVATGAKVLALACDVTDRAELDAALQRIDAELPPLRGVVHAAVALDDAAIANLDAARLHTVFAAKIAGSWNLHEATARHPIDHFVMYSSGTTVVGNPGQANYVAANIFLESLAQYRRARGLPGLSVAWGAIKDVGILARHDGLEDLLQNRTGMSSTPSADALADLGRLMALGATRVSVAGFNIQRLGALLQGTRTPRFLPLASDSVVAALTQSGESLADLVLATPEADRRELVLARLREHVGRVLGTGAGQIDPERSLQEMGLDSLMAVELAESVEQDVGQPVAVMQIIQAGSVAAVCDIVLGLIKGNGDPSETIKLAAE